MIIITQAFKMKNCSTRIYFLWKIEQRDLQSQLYSSQLEFIQVKLLHLLLYKESSTFWSITRTLDLSFLKKCSYLWLSLWSTLMEWFMATLGWTALEKILIDIMLTHSSIVNQLYMQLESFWLTWIKMTVYHFTSISMLIMQGREHLSMGMLLMTLFSRYKAKSSVNYFKWIIVIFSMNSVIFL